MRSQSPVIALCLGLLLSFTTSAQAEEPLIVALTLKDHKFSPLEPIIPAGKPLRLLIKNLDNTPAEFESDDFTAEKIIPAGGQGVILVAPLKAGKYEFHDEYHEAVSKTFLVVQ